MSKFVVIVFPGESQAYQGTRALKELHAEGSLTLYGIAVVAKDAQGKVSIKESADGGPLGTAVGALVGGLVGVLAGPIGMLGGATMGTLLGSMVDLVNLGVGEDFVTKVSGELAAGKSAIIAEIAESWVMPLDARMEALGGTVLRTWRADFEDEQLAKEAAEEQAELKQLQDEYAKANAEAKAKLKAKVDQANKKLDDALRRLSDRLDAIEKETNAKVTALEQQVAQAKTEAKEKIRQQIAAIRADRDARAAKLKQAWQLAKEALAA